MPNNTKNSKRNAALACAAVVVGLLALVLAVILFPLVGSSYGDLAAVLFLGMYALIILAVIVGVLVALSQRLRELEGGEEDEARKY